MTYYISHTGEFQGGKQKNYKKSIVYSFFSAGYVFPVNIFIFHPAFGEKISHENTATWI